MTAFPSPTPDFLSRFESQLESSLDDPRHSDREPRVLLEASRHLAFAGAAKRMRPLLVDYFGAALDIPDHHRLAIATAAELIHTASLLHDDVVDEGTHRRGRPTANHQWNNSVAVLGGDLLLCIALEQLYDLPRQVTVDAVTLVAEMTRAAMLEVEARTSGGWSLAEWEVIADGKTGSLLSWCGVAPAISAGLPEQARRFGQCGRHLGLAFQITDDLLDLIGESARIGKNRFADLHNKNPSYPVALARSRSLPLRTALDELWSKEIVTTQELEPIAAWIIELGVPALTLERIESHLDLALEALGEFSTTAGGAHIAGWAEQLRAMARNSLEGI